MIKKLLLVLKSYYQFKKVITGFRSLTTTGLGVALHWRIGSRDHHKGRLPEPNYNTGT